MKKVFMLLAGLLLFMTVAGCGAAPATVDMDALSQYIGEQVIFSDQLEEIAADAIPGRYQTPEDCQARAWVGSGATAEEFAIFQAADSAAADAVEALLEQHIADMRESFSAYLPAETEKLDRAVLLRQGNALILLICQDSQGESKLNAFFAQ